MENLDPTKLSDLFKEYNTILVESMKNATDYQMALLRDAQHYTRCFVTWGESRLKKEKPKIENKELSISYLKDIKELLINILNALEVK